MIGHLELEGRDLIINTEGSAVLDGVEMVSNGKMFELEDVYVRFTDDWIYVGQELDDREHTFEINRKTLECEFDSYLKESSEL